MERIMRAILPLCLAALLCAALTVPAHAQAQPVSGLVLVADLPLEAEILRNTTDAQGNYLEELMAFEGAIRLVTLRQRVDDAHRLEMPIEDFLSAYFDEIREVEPVGVDPVAAYPTERMRFVTGAEEDTAVIDAVVIRTDEFYFAFWADTQIDMYSGYFDSFAEGEVPELIDLWVESLELFDADASAGAEPISGSSDEPPYWNGLDFGENLEYAEEYVREGDPGDYLNAAEAAKLTFDAVRDDGNLPENSGGAQYTMTLVDIADVAGEECYLYRLDVDGADGTSGAAYAYGYQSGSIYMQGHAGQWVQP